jgi:flagellar assembly protein FliH
LSKIISGKTLKNYEAWLVPSMEEDSRDPSSHLSDDEMLEFSRQQAREEGYEEGFKQGKDEGFAVGKEEAQERVQLFEHLMRGLARPFEELDRQVEEELAALAIAMTRQLIRRGLKENPGQVVAAVREALNVLPASARGITLRVHPDDAVVIREHFFKHDSVPSWDVTEDPGISRGGCKVTTETSSVDATIETRLTAVISQVFGGDRGGD